LTRQPPLRARCGRSERGGKGSTRARGGDTVGSHGGFGPASSLWSSHARGGGTIGSRVAGAFASAAA
jgi:hypothetical protein